MKGKREKEPEMPTYNLAKVGVEGSNPFARSRFPVKRLFRPRAEPLEQIASVRSPWRCDVSRFRPRRGPFEANGRHDTTPTGARRAPSFGIPGEWSDGPRGRRGHCEKEPI
jgi:hypothetical protein